MYHFIISSVKVDSSSDLLLSVLNPAPHITYSYHRHLLWWGLIPSIINSSGSGDVSKVLKKCKVVRNYLGTSFLFFLNLFHFARHVLTVRWRMVVYNRKCTRYLLKNKPFAQCIFSL